jgi:aryl-alcohol dehydrogenase-like predicted oxidoreductase
MEMGPGQSGLSRRYLRSAVEASLRRLQTDHIDLYKSHDDDPATPMEARCYAELIREGRCVQSPQLQRSALALALATSKRLGLPRYETLQPLYNLYDRAAYEAELEPLCRTEGLGVIPFYGLAKGFLTGKYRSAADIGQSPRGAGVKGYLNARGMRILAALDAEAAENRSTPAQVALAWQMARPGLTAPIASATSLAQWQEIKGAASLELSAAAIARLDAASAPDH